MSKDRKTINIARQVIDDEVKALIGLKDYIDENFQEIVDLIYKCKGRLILTGIGKSGHISKKISATLSSTGTSSFFMHSTEAFHGDLGMIQSDDIVVAISYSGETEDLLKTIPIIKKLGCSVIGVSGNDKSTLSKISDYHQLIKVEKEACPLDLAPTSSATATLVWGDALAISLMNKKDLFIFTTLSGMGLDIRTLWENSKAVSPPMHLNFFNPKSINLLLEKVGFEVIEVNTPGKLDIDIMHNNKKHVKDKFWKDFLEYSDKKEKQVMQKYLSDNRLSSHMMTVCRKV